MLKRVLSKLTACCWCTSLSIAKWKDFCFVKKKLENSFWNRFQLLLKRAGLKVRAAPRMFHAGCGLVRLFCVICSTSARWRFSCFLAFLFSLKRLCFFSLFLAFIGPILSADSSVSQRWQTMAYSIRLEYHTVGLQNMECQKQLQLPNSDHLLIKLYVIVARLLDAALAEQLTG